MGARWALIAAAALAFLPISAGAAGPVWQGWVAVPGVFDLGGPRTDGPLVVAGSANLYLVDSAGNLTPFARGPGGYHEDPGAEAYLTLSTGGHVSSAGCDFVRDDTFLLRLHTPLGIERVDAPGQNTGSFANITGVTGLSGITFDTTGGFDHRILASGLAGGKSVIAAIDCNGKVQIVTNAAPPLEGGLAVAPSGFGSFGSDLIAPDENSGRIYAIAPDGTVIMVAKPVLPTGGDIGVESIGFVPKGFMRGGEAYIADRKTANNPHPGNDNILRISSADLGLAGVEDGDMLVATEGGATMIALRCAATCTVLPVISQASTAHGEGHIVFTIDKTAPSPTPSPTSKLSAQPAQTSSSAPIALIAVLLVVVMLAFAVGLVLGRRRR